MTELLLTDKQMDDAMFGVSDGETVIENWQAGDGRLRAIANEAARQAVEYVFERIEIASRPMSTNMAGISLGREQYEAIKQGILEELNTEVKE